MTNCRKMLLAAAALAGAGPAHAEMANFDFSVFYSGGSQGALTVSGGFEANLSNGIITEFSNVSLFRDGKAFRGNGNFFVLQYDFKTRKWIEGGYLSADGKNNNVMFVDSDVANGDARFYNYFYSVTGLGNVFFQPSFYNYRNRDASQLGLQQVRGVPEPSAWALLIAGFGLVGAAMRRRRMGREIVFG